MHGYSWYDWDTGRVDLLALARDAVERLPIEVPEQVPAWLDGFPTELPNAKPADLAKIDARARRSATLAMGK